MTGLIRRALRDRLDADDRERGSLPFLMLVMILSAALGAVLLTTVVSQARTSNFDESRVRSFDAAQAGVDTALAKIRIAVTTADTSVGDAAKLPCYVNSDFTDAGPDGALEFKVSVAYYRTDPATMTRTARDAARMACTGANGPYDSTSSKRVPRYAVITSQGRDVSRSGVGTSRARTLESTYVFQTNDVNVTGGQIRIFPSGGTQFCMDAGSSPVEGTAITLQRCSTSNPAAEQQVFAYRPDLSIELVSTSKPPTPGLCLDTAPTAHESNRAIVLQRCGAADATPSDTSQPAVCPAGTSPNAFALRNPGRTCRNSPWNQRWSIDDNAHLRGSLADESNVDGFCIDAATQTEGQALLLQACAGGTTDERQTWVPTPTTGAGAAGPGNSQIVNYAQFATCIDVTGQNVGAAFMILYTCKQNPNSSAVSWNQKPTPSVTLTATSAPTKVLLTFSSPSGRYCLKSPASEGGYPTLEACTLLSSTAGPLGWTVYQRYQTSAADSPELSYADRYTIKDSSGRCLAPGPNSDLLNGQYYKIVTASCDGSTAQKWNADPSRLRASVTNTRETG